MVYAAVFPCYHCHQCLRGNTNWCMNRNYPAAGVWPYFTGTYADFLYLPPRRIRSSSMRLTSRETAKPIVAIASAI